MISINITPRDIYSIITKEVETLFIAVNGSNNDSADVNNAKVQCHNLLSDIQLNVNKKINELEKNSEWNEFTIALYGETNAGKSTIIETLRIHFSEASKRAEQDTFIELMAKSGLSQSAFSETQQAQERSSQQLAAFEADLAIRTAKDQNDLEALQQVLAAQQSRVETLKANASFWKKALFLFMQPQEVRDLQMMQVRLQERQQEVAQASESLNSQHQTLKTEKTTAERHLANLMGKLTTLSQYADGRIVGNGQSDFTKETRSYRFNSGQGQFVLLDVPGIEGKEEAVIDEITKAIQKAHAVFYITSKASPPQKGENGQPGTLEKIKAHLNDQTEVWTVSPSVRIVVVSNDVMIY